jgi:hypothetical protein
MSEFFALDRAPSPWGDYGNILAHGLADFPKQGPPPATIHLSRTGPYVPPVTQPRGHIIVIDSLRRELERSSFTGFGFSEVEYQKVVRLDWHTWNADADEPQHYPETGEPEDYVLTGSHDPSLLKEMPCLWALSVASTPDLQVGSRTFYADRHPGTDIARHFARFWVSERMKDWLQSAAGAWVDFKLVVPR